MTNRPEMIVALKDVVAPELRARGFKGAFPHFRRLLPSLRVQSSCSGSRLVRKVRRQRHLLVRSS